MNDTQHLDYLISQYVDGCLDAASKKSLEQTLVNDPQARQLYKDQREVQDMLDDWGNRIPMIHWDEFDKRLAARLEHETVGARRVSMFRRWAGPLSIAACLFLAASIGYAWHAWSNPVVSPTNTSIAISSAPVTPQSSIHLDDTLVSRRPSFRGISIDEPNAFATPSALRTDVEITSPDDEAAATSMRDAIRYGLGDDVKRPGSVTAFNGAPPSSPKDKEKEKSSIPTDDPIPYQYP
ncbi:MAG: hypothetical protein FWD61_12785 [Phycisphaerales bacterium]|nr:hypothetical protein [Phycisphaerales bacterium]